VGTSRAAPNEEGLSYLEQVESTVTAHGGKWLAQGDVQVVGVGPDFTVAGFAQEVRSAIGAASGAER
jgi:hypothetical protein